MTFFFFLLIEYLLLLSDFFINRRFSSQTARFVEFWVSGLELATCHHGLSVYMVEL